MKNLIRALILLWLLTINGLLKALPINEPPGSAVKPLVPLVELVEALTFPICKENLSSNSSYKKVAHFFHTEDEFLKAHELYQNILNKKPTLGYLYKFREKKYVQRLYKRQFRKITKNFFDLNQAKKQLEQFGASKNPIDQRIVKKLNEIKYLEQVNEILQSRKNKELQNKRLNDLNLSVHKKLRLWGTEDFFNIKQAKILENKGAIYVPKNYHSWPVNLSWLLAHLKQKNTFKISSEVKGKRKRMTQRFQHEYSAFAKEICVCLKAGYRLIFTKKNNNSFLIPPPHFNFDNVLLGETKTNHLEPSDQEVQKLFDLIEVGYAAGEDFSFSIEEGLKIRDSVSGSNKEAV